MIWGIDISNWQGDAVNLYTVAAEGFDFAIFKSTEGSSYVDPKFGENLRDGRGAGLVCAAYHYQRAGDAAGQVANIRRTVPTDCPLILDVEANGGGVGTTWDLTNRLRDAGYHLPLLYLPRWYWNQIGSPNLAGLPPLWYSHYANYEGGPVSAIFNRDAAWHNAHWGGYGGLHVEILQFTSSATVAGHAPVDGNAYRGTRQQLEALMYSGGGSGGATGAGGIETMGFNDGYTDWAGNDQTVLSWMNHVDQRVSDLHAALLGLQQSRIPGDDNQTNVVNAVMDSTSWAAQTLGHSAAAAFELTYQHPSRVEGSSYADTMLGYTVNADMHGFENARRLDALEAQITAIADKLGVNDGSDQ